MPFIVLLSMFPYFETRILNKHSEQRRERGVFYSEWKIRAVFCGWSSIFWLFCSRAALFTATCSTRGIGQIGAPLNLNSNQDNQGNLNLMQQFAFYFIFSLLLNRPNQFKFVSFSLYPGFLCWCISEIYLVSKLRADNSIWFPLINNSTRFRS